MKFSYVSILISITDMSKLYSENPSGHPEKAFFSSIYLVYAIRVIYLWDFVALCPPYYPQLRFFAVFLFNGTLSLFFLLATPHGANLGSHFSLINYQI